MAWACFFPVKICLFQCNYFFPIILQSNNSCFFPLLAWWTKPHLPTSLNHWVHRTISGTLLSPWFYKKGTKECSSFLWGKTWDVLEGHLLKFTTDEFGVDFLGSPHWKVQCKQSYPMSPWWIFSIAMLAYQGVNVMNSASRSNSPSRSKHLGELPFTKLNPTMGMKKSSCQPPMLEEGSKFIPTTGILNQAPRNSEMLGCCSRQKKTWEIAWNEGWRWSEWLRLHLSSPRWLRSAFFFMEGCYTKEVTGCQLNKSGFTFYSAYKNWLHVYGCDLICLVDWEATITIIMPLSQEMKLETTKLPTKSSNVGGSLPTCHPPKKINRHLQWCRIHSPFLFLRIPS